VCTSGNVLGQGEADLADRGAARVGGGEVLGVAGLADGEEADPVGGGGLHGAHHPGGLDGCSGGRLYVENGEGEEGRWRWRWSGGEEGGEVEGWSGGRGRDGRKGRGGRGRDGREEGGEMQGEVEVEGGRGRKSV
jgi:hypothetical protein